jgi:hypothetical protein
MRVGQNGGPLPFEAIIDFGEPIVYFLYFLHGQSMTAAVLPTGHFDTAAGMPNPPCRVGVLILSAASHHSSRSRWAVLPVGHFLPWPMRAATVSRIFVSNREKKGRVFAVASSPRPRKSVIGFRHARVSWSAVWLCAWPSRSTVRSIFSKASSCFSSRNLLTNAGSPMGYQQRQFRIRRGCRSSHQDRRRLHPCSLGSLKVARTWHQAARRSWSH